jgi:DNA polymerase-1
MRQWDGRSTGKEVLEKLPQDHPVIKALKRHRKAAKMLSTYVLAVQKAIEADGRIHATFLIHGTRTGRLSSRKPNMQNQPREPEVRSHFVSPINRRLIAIDLNQAELRSLAHCSGDPALCAIFKDPTKGSLHDEVAELLFPGWKMRKGSKDFIIQTLAKEQKMKAKNVNFGIVYGITAAGLAEQMSSPTNPVSSAEAQLFLDKWAKRFPVAWAFIQKCRMAAANGETISTPFGRQKRHWVVSRENLHALMNEAANFPHQSIAHDIVLHTGIEIMERKLLEPLNAFFINEIHDELLIEAPDDDEITLKIIQMVIEVMERKPTEWNINRVPFKAEAKTGYRWGHMRDYDLPELKQAA